MNWKTPIKALLCTGFLTVLGDPAAAAPVSDYTKIDLDACPMIEAPSEEGTFGGTWSCPGYGGMPVLVTEGDLRMFVSFGRNAKQESAATQTLSGFNTINDTLEWRIRNGRPYATILRWFMDTPDGSDRIQVLVVTQLTPGATCQVARINASANTNANVLAREAADQLAGSYVCEQGPIIFGNPGKLD